VLIIGENSLLNIKDVGLKNKKKNQKKYKHFVNFIDKFIFLYIFAVTKSELFRNNNCITKNERRPYID